MNRMMLFFSFDEKSLKLHSMLKLIIFLLQHVLFLLHHSDRPTVATSVNYETSHPVFLYSIHKNLLTDQNPESSGAVA